MTGRKTKIHQRRGIDFEIENLSQRFWELGRRITAPMMRYQLDRISLHDMLANAYLQGIQHGYEVCENRFVPVQTEDGT